MPSAIYQIFRTAIRERKQITCAYNGCRREVCPHVLGFKDGQEMALTFQFAGDSNSGLPPGGEWRCLALAQVSDARMRDGPWHTGCSHRTTQVCVDIVDLDVNR
jgi:predicted DNA-binding transcriptional regulator YafY